MYWVVEEEVVQGIPEHTEHLPNKVTVLYYEH